MVELDKALKNKALTDFAFRNLTMKTVIECFFACLEDCLCLSFQMCNETECQLSSSNQFQSTLVTMTECTYYDMHPTASQVRTLIAFSILNFSISIFTNTSANKFYSEVKAQYDSLYLGLEFVKHMYILWGTNTSTNTFQFQGLKMRHIVKGALRTLKGCLYESRDWTFGGTGRYSGSRHVYASMTFIAFRLYEAGTFFVLSHLGRISHSAAGIPPQAGRFLSYKYFIPPDWH